MLLTKDADVLAHWLCVFISEIRKTDGGEYTPRSLSQTRGDVEENQTIMKGMNFHDMEGCTINFQLAFIPSDSQCYMYLAIIYIIII